MSSADIHTQHLDLCRDLREQLRRIAGSQQDKQENADTNIPVNLARFLNEFDQYIGWAEKNKVTIEASLQTKPNESGSGGDGV